MLSKVKENRIYHIATKPALLSYIIQNMSTKPVKNCSMQSAQACTMTAPNLHQNGKGNLCAESIKTACKNNSK